MGYDLHITRRRHWADAGRDIFAEEWLRLVAQDPELTLAPHHGPWVAVWHGPSTLDAPWMDWSGGNISTKNPDRALIAKMVQLARQLDATVQGDDGETYGSDIAAPRPYRLSIRERLRSVADLFRRSRPRARAPSPTLPFAPGDRVRDARGREGVVLTIDRSADHALGTVRVRFDDGRELGFSAIAHGLTLSNPKSPEAAT
jgi:hypothetical protein